MSDERSMTARMAEELQRELREARKGGGRESGTNSERRVVPDHEGSGSAANPARQMCIQAVHRRCGHDDDRIRELEAAVKRREHVIEYWKARVKELEERIKILERDNFK